MVPGNCPPRKADTTGARVHARMTRKIRSPQEYLVGQKGERPACLSGEELVYDEGASKLWDDTGRPTPEAGPYAVIGSYHR